MATRREGDTAASPTAKFLQARIDTLRTTLVRRLETIFAAALDDVDPATGPPSITDTAVKQMQIDVESTALIRAAEEIMVLTRTMKELWLFGGLDTIKEDDVDAQQVMGKMQADEQYVVRGLMEYLSKLDADGGDSDFDLHIPMQAEQKS